jgi:hypothetical protein
MQTFIFCHMGDTNLHTLDSTNFSLRNKCCLLSSLVTLQNVFQCLQWVRHTRYFRAHVFTEDAKNESKYDSPYNPVKREMQNVK